MNILLSTELGMIILSQICDGENPTEIPIVTKSYKSQTFLSQSANCSVIQWCSNSIELPCWVNFTYFCSKRLHVYNQKYILQVQACGMWGTDDVISQHISPNLWKPLFTCCLCLQRKMREISVLNLIISHSHIKRFEKIFVHVSLLLCVPKRNHMPVPKTDSYGYLQQCSCCVLICIVKLVEI